MQPLSTSGGALSGHPPRTAAATSPLLPSAAMRFFATFLSRLHAHNTDGATQEAKNAEEDVTLRRLSPSQAEAIGPLLWQWMLLLLGQPDPYLDTSPSGAAARTSREESRSPFPLLRTPSQVDRLFTTGLSQLVPVAGAAAAEADVRNHPADMQLPWYHSLGGVYMRGSSTDHSLTRALTRLSSRGPLYSSWCSLYFLCMPLEEAPTAKEALTGLHRAWAAAVAHRTTSDKSSGRRTDVAGAEGTPMALDDVQQLWRVVYVSASSSPTTDHEPSPLASPPHPLFSVWVAQWFYECCRVAAHGHDDGGGGGVAATVSVELLARVMHHQCRRLGEEMDRAAVQEHWQHQHVSSARTKELDPSTENNAVVTSVASPRAALRIATLTGLALHAPKVTTASATTATTRHGSSDGTRGGTTRRKRRRRWRVSDSDSESEDDDDDDDGNWAAEWGDAQAVDLLHGGRGGRRRTALERFLSAAEQSYSVAIASSVLTSYTVSPLALSALGGVGGEAAVEKMEEDNTACAVALAGESYLRQGEVQWWTVGNTQRQRQLMSDKRI